MSGEIRATLKKDPLNHSYSTAINMFKTVINYIYNNGGLFEHITEDNTFLRISQLIVVSNVTLRLIELINLV